MRQQIKYFTFNRVTGHTAHHIMSDVPHIRAVLSVALESFQLWQMHAESLIVPIYYHSLSSLPLAGRSSLAVSVRAVNIRRNRQSAVRRAYRFSIHRNDDGQVYEGIYASAEKQIFGLHSAYRLSIHKVHTPYATCHIATYIQMGNRPVNICDVYCLCRFREFRRRKRITNECENDSKCISNTVR